MRVDLQVPDTWQALNSVYREALVRGNGPPQNPAQTQALFQVQAYLGAKHAIWETCTQLAQLQPNRRTVIYLQDSAAVFDSVAVHLSREGFKVKAMTEAELRSPSTWLEALQKDLLFVFTAIDDPLTGEVFEFPELALALQDKRSYQVRLSHSRHRWSAPREPGPLDAEILSLSVDRAIVWLGDRVKLQPPVASGMSWPSTTLESARRALERPSDQEAARLRSLVESFEGQPPKGAERVLGGERARLYDRALIAFRDLDGFALISLLAEALETPLGSPGEAGPLETASLCRWGDERALGGYQKRGWSAEVLRGLMIIDSRLLARADFAEKLKVAREQVLRMQSGD